MPARVEARLDHAAQSCASEWFHRPHHPLGGAAGVEQLPVPYRPRAGSHAKVIVAGRSKRCPSQALGHDPLGSPDQLPGADDWQGTTPVGSPHQLQGFHPPAPFGEGKSAGSRGQGGFCDLLGAKLVEHPVGDVERPGQRRTPWR